MENYGQFEGRTPNSIATREDFQREVWNHAEPKESALELSPFAAPVLGPSRGLSCDVIPYDDLVIRAKAQGYNPRKVAKPDFIIDPSVGLQGVSQRFNTIVSSHVIEHTPDLVGHLSDIQNLLLPGCRYFLFIPDKRYCFDHFLPDTTIADVIEAQRAHHKRHTLRSVIEHRALTTHNDPIRHWQNDHFDAGYVESIPARTRQAIAEFDASDEGYIDVHAWKFTPEGFRSIANQVIAIFSLDLEVERAYSTRHGSNEFWAVIHDLKL